MWLVKKKRVNDNFGGYVEEDYIDTKVCNDCGCIIVKNKAECVYDLTNWSNSDTYYCKKCKPPYDKTYIDRQGEQIYFSKITEHYIPVTKDGKEIKNVPSKNKK